MKKVLVTIFALAVSINAHSAMDKVEVLRTLSCEGTLMGSNNTTKEFSAKITDTKSTYTIAKNPIVDYWSSLTFNDLKNDGRELLGNLTSADESTDLEKQRDAPRDGSWQGLTFYEIYKDKEDSKNIMDKTGKFGRLGLIVISSTCTTEELPEAKKCPNPRGKRLYEVAVQYGELNDKDAIAFAGKIECRLIRKN